MDEQENKRFMLINGIGVGIILLLIAILAVTTALDVSKIHAQIVDNEKQTIALQEETKKIPPAKKEDVSSVKATYHSAEEAGGLVAEKQNEYAKTNVSSKTFEEDLKKISSAIGKHFAEDTASQTARTPWYKPNNLTEAYTWRFLSNYSFEGKNLGVIWVCESGSNVLAYATATYDGSTKKFSDFHTTMTGLGTSYFKSEGSPTDGQKPEENTAINGVVSEIQKAIDETNKTTPQQEQKAQEEYRNNINDIQRARELNRQEKEGNK